jgi:hypothetical protein
VFSELTQGLSFQGEESPGIASTQSRYHTLATVIPAMEQLTGATVTRAITEAGYKGHSAPAPFAGSYHRPETRRYAGDQTCLQAPCRRRTPHRPYQRVPSYGPQSARPRHRQRHQRRLSRGRIQLHAPAQVAQALIAPDLASDLNEPYTSISVRNRKTHGRLNGASTPGCCGSHPPTP